jgi:hypothetical protein
MTRRNMHIPDALWDRAAKAAELEAEQTGQSISTSEWIRRAMFQKLAQHDAIQETLEAVRKD